MRIGTGNGRPSIDHFTLLESRGFSHIVLLPATRFQRCAGPGRGMLLIMIGFVVSLLFSLGASRLPADSSQSLFVIERNSGIDSPRHFEHEKRFRADRTVVALERRRSVGGEELAHVGGGSRLTGMTRTVHSVALKHILDKYKVASLSAVASTCPSTLQFHSCWPALRVAQHNHKKLAPSTEAAIAMYSLSDGKTRATNSGSATKSNLCILTCVADCTSH